MASATLRAKRLLRGNAIARAVARARRRNESPTAALSKAEVDIDFDVNAARRYVARFQSLRPLAYSARNGCLLNSLALLEFLAPYRIFPRWVFGVMVRPFMAHCWLQCGRIVLNDVPEHVRNYTPIMAV